MTKQSVRYAIECRTRVSFDDEKPGAAWFVTEYVRNRRKAERLYRSRCERQPDERWRLRKETITTESMTIAVSGRKAKPGPEVSRIKA